MNPVEREIARFIATEVLTDRSIEMIPCDALLLQEGIIDSLGLQKLLVFLEQEHSVTIGEDDLVPENFESISAIAGLIDKLRESKVVAGC
jgi:acyl carrier protein